MFGKPKPKRKSTSDDDIIQDMLTAIAGEQDKRARRKGKWHQRVVPAWLDSRLVGGALLILIVIIADGVRRENAEFSAVVTQVQGTVTWATGATSRSQALVPGTKLTDDAVVTTALSSTCTLEFPDQSVIVVAPGSQFTVTLLEYQRGGRWRGRSFYLKAGEVFARVTPNFGKQSQLRVYTPSSVAAVRGTTFYVSYSPPQRAGACMCGEGTVRLDGLSGLPAQVNMGTVSITGVGLSPGRAVAIDTSQASAFAAPALIRTVKPDPWYKRAELALTQTLNAPLTILGVGKASWSVGSTDFARRTAAKESLRQLRIHIEGYSKYPLFIDPATLAGLGVDEQEAVRLLKSFDCRAIERYEPVNGGQTFRIFARARDTQRTRFVLDMSGVAIAEDQS